MHRVVAYWAAASAAALTMSACGGDDAAARAASDGATGIDSQSDGSSDGAFVVDPVVTSCSSPKVACYQDTDGDGEMSLAISSCLLPAKCVASLGVLEPGTDCNDQNPAIKFRTVEVAGDGIDNNCDGKTDEPCPSSACAFDDDGDHATSTKTFAMCGKCPKGTSDGPGKDCNDANAKISPSHYEPESKDLTPSDGVDNDCDGLTDEPMLKVEFLDVKPTNGSTTNAAGATKVTSLTVSAVIKVTNESTVAASGAIKLNVVLYDEQDGSTATKTLDLATLAPGATATLNGGKPVDFGNKALKTDGRIGNSWTLTVATPGDERFFATRTVVYDLTGRGETKAMVGDKAQWQPATTFFGVGTPIVTEIFKDLASNITASVNVNNLLAAGKTVSWDDGIYDVPGCASAASGPSQYGAPQSLFGGDLLAGKSNYSYKDGEKINGYLMLNSIKTANVQVSAKTIKGSMSPNSAAGYKTGDGQSDAVKDQHLEVTMEFGEIELHLAEQDFKCKSESGCQAKDGIIAKLHEDLKDNALSMFEEIWYRDEIYVTIKGVRLTLIGMLTVPKSGTPIAGGVSGNYTIGGPQGVTLPWAYGYLGSMSSDYPEPLNVSTLAPETVPTGQSQPYMDFSAMPGMQAFVLDRVKLEVVKTDGKWGVPSSYKDVAVSHSSSNEVTIWSDDKLAEAMQEGLYSLAVGLPNNKALINDIMQDGGNEEDRNGDKVGLMFLKQLYCGMVGKANPELGWEATPGGTEVKTEAPHDLEVGDRVYFPTATCGPKAQTPYWVHSVVDAKTFTLAATAGASAPVQFGSSSLKCTGSVVEGPYGHHPRRFYSEYDMIEYAMDMTYAKQWSNGRGRQQLAAHCPSGEQCPGEAACYPTWVSKDYASVGVLAEGGISFSVATGVHQPSGQTFAATSYFSGGQASEVAGTSCDITRLRMSESAVNASFLKQYPNGFLKSTTVLFNCDGNATTGGACPDGSSTGCEGSLNIAVSGRTPYARMRSDGAGYDVDMEGVTLQVSEGAGCKIPKDYPYTPGGGSGTYTTQEELTAPLLRCTLGEHLGRGTLSMTFETPSEWELNKAQTTYLWAQPGTIDLCGRNSTSQSTPFSMFSTVKPAASAKLFAPKRPPAGCLPGGGADLVYGQLEESFAAAVLAATRQQACGDCAMVNGSPSYPNAFEAMVPVGPVTEANANAYCTAAETCEPSAEGSNGGCVFVQRMTKEGFAAEQVMLGNVSASKADKTVALAMTEWTPTGTTVTTLCGDSGNPCGQCCPNNTSCLMSMGTAGATWTCQ